MKWNGNFFKRTKLHYSDSDADSRAHYKFQKFSNRQKRQLFSPAQPTHHTSTRLVLSTNLFPLSITKKYPIWIFRITSKFTIILLMGKKHSQVCSHSFYEFIHCFIIGLYWVEKMFWKVHAVHHSIINMMQQFTSTRLDYSILAIFFWSPTWL